MKKHSILRRCTSLLLCAAMFLTLVPTELIPSAKAIEELLAPTAGGERLEFVVTYDDIHDRFGMRRPVEELVELLENGHPVTLDPASVKEEELTSDTDTGLDRVRYTISGLSEKKDYALRMKEQPGYQEDGHTFGDDSQKAKKLPAVETDTEGLLSAGEAYHYILQRWVVSGTVEGAEQVVTMEDYFASHFTVTPSASIDMALEQYAQTHDLPQSQLSGQWVELAESPLLTYRQEDGLWNYTLVMPAKAVARLAHGMDRDYIAVDARYTLHNDLSGLERLGDTTITHGGSGRDFLYGVDLNPGGIMPLDDGDDTTPANPTVAPLKVFWKGDGPATVGDNKVDYGDFQLNITVKTGDNVQTVRVKQFRLNNNYTVALMDDDLEHNTQQFTLSFDQTPETGGTLVTVTLDAPASWADTTNNGTVEVQSYSLSYLHNPTDDSYLEFTTDSETRVTVQRQNGVRTQTDTIEAKVKFQGDELLDNTDHIKDVGDFILTAELESGETLRFEADHHDNGVYTITGDRGNIYELPMNNVSLVADHTTGEANRNYSVKLSNLPHTFVYEGKRYTVQNWTMKAEPPEGYVLQSENAETKTFTYQVKNGLKYPNAPAAANVVWQDPNLVNHAGKDHGTFTLTPTFYDKDGNAVELKNQEGDDLLSPVTVAYNSEGVNAEGGTYGYHYSFVDPLDPENTCQGELTIDQHSARMTSAVKTDTLPSSLYRDGVRYEVHWDMALTEAPEPESVENATTYLNVWEKPADTANDVPPTYYLTPSNTLTFNIKVNGDNSGGTGSSITSLYDYLKDWGGEVELCEGTAGQSRRVIGTISATQDSDGTNHYFVNKADENTKYEIGAEMVISPDGIQGHYQLILTGMPRYNIDKDEQVYSLLAKKVEGEDATVDTAGLAALNLTEDQKQAYLKDSILPRYENETLRSKYDYSGEEDLLVNDAAQRGCYSGGTLSLTLSGYTYFTFTKEWYQDAHVVIPTTEFSLWRFLRSNGNFTTASAVYDSNKQAVIEPSVFNGQSAINMAAANASAGDSAQYKQADGTPVQATDTKLTERHTMLLLPKYNAEGHRYTYIAREDTNQPGDYVAHFFDVKKDAAGNVVKDAEGNIIYTRRSEERKNDTSIYNNEKAENYREDTRYSATTKRWVAGEYQSLLSGVTVLMELQAQLKYPDEDGVTTNEWRSTGIYLKNGSRFYAERLVQEYYTDYAPKYSNAADEQKGLELELRWVEVAAFEDTDDTEYSKKTAAQLADLMKKDLAETDPSKKINKLVKPNAQSNTATLNLSVCKPGDYFVSTTQTDGKVVNSVAGTGNYLVKKVWHTDRRLAEVQFVLHRVDSDGNDVIVGDTNDPLTAVANQEPGGKVYTIKTNVDDAEPNVQPSEQITPDEKGCYPLPVAQTQVVDGVVELRNLPNYDPTGKAYRYYVREVPLPGYGTTYRHNVSIPGDNNENDDLSPWMGYNNGTHNSVIDNHETGAPVFPIKVRKIWLDDGDTASRRPTTIQILLPNGDVFDTVTLSESNNWWVENYYRASETQNSTYPYPINGSDAEKAAYLKGFTIKEVSMGTDGTYQVVTGDGKPHKTLTETQNDHANDPSILSPNGYDTVTTDKNEYEVFYESDLATEQLRKDPSTVAMVGGKAYPKLNDAIAAAQDGDTITLYQNVTTGAVVDGNKSITIDLNGKTISNSGSKTTLLVTSGSELTIEGDGKVEATGSGNAAVGVVPGGKATIKGGNYSSKGWYVFRNMGDMVIEGNTKIQGFDGLTASLVENGWYGDNGSNDKLNGTLYKESDYGTKGATLTINGGIFVSGNKTMNAIKNDDFGTLIINNGRFDSTANSEEKAIQNWNEATINGGLFTGVNLIHNGTYNIEGDRGLLTINGGTFTATKTLFTGSGRVVTINGGKFDVPKVGMTNVLTLYIDGTTYNAQNYTGALDALKALPAQPSADPTPASLDLPRGDTGVARVGDEYYSTLAAAVAAAPANSTITLLANVTEQFLLNVDKALTLDLNSHNITTASKTAILVRQGKLTVTGQGTVSVSNKTAYAAITVCPDGEAVLNGGHYTVARWYVAKNLGKLTINDGVTMTENNAYNSSLLDNGWVSATDTIEGVDYPSTGRQAILTVNGGTLTAGVKTIAVLKNDDNGFMTINGGTFDSTPSATGETVLNWNVGTINGGEFKGNHLIYGAGDKTNHPTGQDSCANQGILTVNGGSFEGGLLVCGAYADATVELNGGSFDVQSVSTAAGTVKVQGTPIAGMDENALKLTLSNMKKGRDTDNDGFYTVYNRRIGRVKFEIETDWLDGNVGVKGQDNQYTSALTESQIRALIESRKNSNLIYNIYTENNTTENNTPVASVSLNELLDYATYSSMLENFEYTHEDIYTEAEKTDTLVDSLMKYLSETFGRYAPKYDEQGRVIRYHVSLDNASTAAYPEEHYKLISSGSSGYTVGAVHITDTAKFRYRFLKEDEKEISFTKDWRDVAQYEAGNRPDIYLQLYAYDYDQNKLVNLFQKCRWAKGESGTVTDDDGNNTDITFHTNGSNDYLWQCTFKGLPEYDSVGREIVYYTAEHYSGNEKLFDYADTQYRYNNQPVDPPVDPNAATFSGNQGSTAAELAPLMAVDVDVGEKKIYALKEGGRFVNKLEGYVDILGTKVWVNLPLGFDLMDLPTLQFILQQAVQPENNAEPNWSSVAVSPEFFRKGMTTFHYEFKHLGRNNEDGSVPTTAEEVASFGSYAPDAIDALDDPTNRSWANETGLMPKYDPSGRRYLYQVVEEFPGLTDKQIEVVEAVGNQGNTYTIQNTYKDNTTSDEKVNYAKLTVNKQWDVPGWMTQSNYPDTTFALYRTYLKNNGTYETPHLVEEKTLTKGANSVDDKLTFDKLEVVAPNFDKFIYFVVEKPLHGYAPEDLTITPGSGMLIYSRPDITPPTGDGPVTDPVTGSENTGGEDPQSTPTPRDGEEAPETPGTIPTRPELNASGGWTKVFFDDQLTNHTVTVGGTVVADKRYYSYPFVLEHGVVVNNDPQPNSYELSYKNKYKEIQDVKEDFYQAATKTWNDFDDTLNTRPAELIMTLYRTSAKVTVPQMVGKLHFTRGTEENADALNIRFEYGTFGSNEHYNTNEVQITVTPAFDTLWTSSEWKYDIYGVDRYAPDGEEWQYTLEEESSSLPTFNGESAPIYHMGGSLMDGSLKATNTLKTTTARGQKEWGHMASVRRPDVIFALQVKRSGDNEQWMWAKNYLSGKMPSDYAFEKKLPGTAVDKSVAFTGLPLYAGGGANNDPVVKLSYRVVEVQVGNIPVWFGVNTTYTDATASGATDTQKQAVEMATANAQNPNLHFEISVSDSEDGITTTTTNSLAAPYAQLEISKTFQQDFDNLYKTRLEDETSWYVDFALHQDYYKKGVSERFQTSPVYQINSDVPFVVRLRPYGERYADLVQGDNASSNHYSYYLKSDRAYRITADKDDDGKWHYTIHIENLPAYADELKNDGHLEIYDIVYRAVELANAQRTEVANGQTNPVYYNGAYATDYVNSKVENAGDNEHIQYRTEVTNRLFPLNVEVTKVWAGDSSTYRPDSVQLKLWQINKTTNTRKDITDKYAESIGKSTENNPMNWSLGDGGWTQIADNRWSYTFHDLPKTAEDGAPCRYEVTEVTNAVGYLPPVYNTVDDISEDNSRASVIRCTITNSTTEFTLDKIGINDVSIYKRTLAPADPTPAAPVPATPEVVEYPGAELDSTTTLSALLSHENNAGKVIRLTGNVTEDVVVKVNNNSTWSVTLDLNGHTLRNKSDKDTIYVELGANLNIQDSSGGGLVENVNHGKAALFNNGTVTITGGTFTRSQDNIYYTILNHGSMTIKSATVSTTGSSAALIENGYSNDGNSTGERVGYVSNQNWANPALTIEDGLFVGGLIAVKNDSNATLTVENGMFANSGQTCIQNNSGATKATINGGTFNGAVSNGATMTINGGTFNSTVSNTDSLTIKGGSFQTAPTGSGITFNGGIFKNPDPTGIVPPTGYELVGGTVVKKINPDIKLTITGNGYEAVWIRDVNGAERVVVTKGGKAIHADYTNDGTPVTIKGLPRGTYVVTENVTPKGYRTPDSLGTITIGADSHSAQTISATNALVIATADNVTVKNEPASVRLDKVSTAGGSAEGNDYAVFEVTGVFTTVDSNGIATTDTQTFYLSNREEDSTWDGQPVRTFASLDGRWVANQSYTITEVYAPAGYKWEHRVATFSLDANGKLVEQNQSGAFLTVSGEKITYSNEPITLTIKKVKDGTTTELNGAQFTLKDEDTQAIATVGPVNGSITLSVKTGDVTLTTGHSYTLTETKAPDGYILPGTLVTGDNGTVTNTAPLTIHFKLDEVGNGKLVAVSEDTTSFTANHGKGSFTTGETEITVVNEPIVLNFAKKETNGAELNDTNFTFSIAGEFATGNSPLTVDKDHREFSAEFIYGQTYTLTETKAPDGYKRMQGDVQFKVNSDGTIKLTKDNSKATLSDNKLKLTLNNDPISISLDKKGIDGADMSTAQFTVEGNFVNLDSPPTGLTPGTFEDTLKGELKHGQIYTVTETNAPDGYEVTKFTFTVDEYGVINNVTHDSGFSGSVRGMNSETLTVTDIPITMTLDKVETGKTDSIEGTDHAVFLISGTFAGVTETELYVTNGAKDKDWPGKPENINQTTFAELNTNAKWVKGVDYTITEVYAPAGYKREQNTAEFSFDEKGVLKKKSGGDFLTVSGEKITYSNEPITLTIKKVKDGSSDLLDGAEFTLRDTETNAEATVKPANGSITLSVKTGDVTLTTGHRYTLTETKAPNGYILPGTLETQDEKVVNTAPLTISFMLDEDGNGNLVAVAEVDNDSTGEEPSGEPAPQDDDGDDGDDNKVEFTATHGTGSFTTGETEITVENQPIVLSFDKKGTDGVALDKSNFTFSIAGKFTTGTNSPLTVNKDKLVSTAEFIYGDQTYTLTETTAPDGYKRMQGDVQFTVNSDGTINLTEENSKAEVSNNNLTLTLNNAPIMVSMNKTDMKGDSLTGASFEVTGIFANKTVSETKTTTNFADLSKQLICGNSYEVVESTIPNGYEGIRFTLTVREYGDLSVTKDDGYASEVTVDGDTGVITVKDKPITMTLDKVKTGKTGSIEGTDHAVFLISGTFAGLTETKLYVTNGAKDMDWPGKPENINQTTFAELNTNASWIQGVDYTITEVYAPAGYKREQNTAKFSFDEKGNLVSDRNNGAFFKAEGEKITYSNAPITLTINKVVYGTTTPLTGAEFTLRDEDDKTEATVKPANGSITLSIKEDTVTLTTGHRYTLTETKAPNGYILPDADKRSYTFTLKSDGTGVVVTNDSANDLFTASGSTITVKNNPIVLKFAKVGTDNANLSATGFEYTLSGLFAKDDGTTETRTETIKEDNTQLSAKLVYGDHEYTLTETKAPDGYKLDDTPVKFKVNSNGEIEFVGQHTKMDYTSGTLTLTMKDDPIILTLNKQNSSGSPLTGAEFTVTDTSVTPNVSVNVIMTSGTIQLGKSTLSNITLTNGHSYTVTETKAPDGYEVTKFIFTVDEKGKIKNLTPGNGFSGSVSGEGEETLTVTDTPITMRLDKVSTVGGTAEGNDCAVFLISGTFAGVSEEEFYVSNATNVKQTKWTIPDGVTVHPFSDLDGKFIAKTQTYTIEEVYAPAGYKREQDKATFKFDEKGNLVSKSGGDFFTAEGETITYSNEPITLTIKKQSNDTTQKPLDGAEFTLTDTTADTVDKNITVTESNGTLVLVSKVTNVTLTTGHSYTLTETKAPNGYILPASPTYTFTLNENGTGVVTNASGNDLFTASGSTITVKNNPIVLKFAKVGTDGAELDGTNFTFSITGTFASGVESLTVDKTHLSFSAEFIYGQTYTLTETTAPDGYKKMVGDVQFKVNSDGTINLTKDNSKATLSGNKLELTLNNDPILVAMNKVGEALEGEENRSLDDAEFTVTGVFADEETSKTVTAADFDNLSKQLICGNSYEVVESTIPAGYEGIEFTITVDEFGAITYSKDNTVWNSTVETAVADDGTVTFNVTDMQTSINLTKVLPPVSTGTVSTSNPIVFTVTDCEDSTKTQTLTINNPDNLTIYNALKGWLVVDNVYEVTEQVPSGFTALSPFKFKLDEKGDITLVNYNGDKVSAERDKLTIENSAKDPEIIGATLFIENQIGINFYVDFGGVPVKDGAGKPTVGQSVDLDEAQKYFVRMYFQDQDGNYIQKNDTYVYKDVHFNEDAYNFMTVDNVTHPIFRFTYWGYAYNMGENVVAVLYKEEDGKKVRVDTSEKNGLRYSVRRYADAMLKKTDAGANGTDNNWTHNHDQSEAELRKTLVAMLNYGAFSQKYAAQEKWGASTPWGIVQEGWKLPTADLSKDQLRNGDVNVSSLDNTTSQDFLAELVTGNSDKRVPGVSKSDLEGYERTTTGGIGSAEVENAPVTLEGISLTMDEGASVSMTLHIKVKDEYALNHSNIEVSSDAIKSIMVEGVRENLPYTIVTSDDGKWGWKGPTTHGIYTFTISNIPVYRWEDAFKFSFKVGQAGENGEAEYQEYSVTYSVMSYVYSKLSENGGADAFDNLLKSMYLYNQDSADYFSVLEREDNYYDWSYNDEKQPMKEQGGSGNNPSSPAGNNTQEG